MQLEYLVRRRFIQGLAALAAGTAANVGCAAPVSAGTQAQTQPRIDLLRQALAQVFANSTTVTPEVGHAIGLWVDGSHNPNVRGLMFEDSRGSTKLIRSDVDHLI